MRIARKWIIIAFIVMLDQEVVGVEVDYQDEYPFHSFAFAINLLIRVFDVIPISQIKSTYRM